MPLEPLVLLHAAATLGCGLIGGVFFAFSTFVMQALTRLPPSSGVAAMQAINVVVLNPLFLGVFLGTAAASATLVVVAALGVAPLAWAGAGLLYLLGTFGVTMAANVPLNRRLESRAPDDPATQAFWIIYVRRWTAWNHVRTAAALLAAAVLIVARPG